MAQYDLGVLGGDGIGPEVTREAMRVVRRAAEFFGFTLTELELPYGADDALSRPGEPILPDRALDRVRDLDAVLLGAIGDPRFGTGVLERAIVGRLRFDLDLYINLRPIRLYAEHLCPLKGVGTKSLDLVVVRENTEDAYTLIGGSLKKNTPDEVAQQTMIYTRKGVDRCLRYAFGVAEQRKKRLVLVDKANAIPAHDLWRRAFTEMGERDFPGIERDMHFVDACCMWLVKNPESYDAIVTTNLFGDIITDLGAMLQGGLGVAAGGNIHPGRVSVFEPIHGSAPKYKGQNVANPIAAILSAAMMLDHLGEPLAAHAIESAVEGLLVSKAIPSLRAGALPTDKVGDLVLEAFHQEASRKSA